MSIDLYEACKAQLRDGASELALGPFLASLIWITRAQRALDVGTGHGASAIAMAIAMREMWECFPERPQHHDCRSDRRGLRTVPAARPYVLSIEQPGVHHDEFTGEIARLGLNSFIRYVHADCFAMALEPDVAEREWDVAFLDATKTPEEALAFLPLIRKDGFAVFHDFWGSGIPEICAKLDRSPALEGILCDSGFMSWRCYRIKARLDPAALRELLCVK